MSLPINKILCGDWIEVLKTLPDNIFHCCITSPPYWGQRLYSWGSDGSCYDKEKKTEVHLWRNDHTLQVCDKCGAKAPLFGMEKTPEEHIEKLVEGFREVRRVLRPDGVLWLNYGDKYATHTSKRSGQFGKPIKKGFDDVFTRKSPKYDMAEGNLLMLPARVALALQADGWILRSDVIWAKALSFCDSYSGSTMPESVNGTRWERHRVKVKKASERISMSRSKKREVGIAGGISTDRPEEMAQWIDCPGCEKCEKNGGLILRRGSWRCTKGHEYIFQLVKSGNYFCDMEAVREENSDNSHEKGNRLKPPIESAGVGHKEFCSYTPEKNNPAGRNLRDVWVINPQAYPGAHYATFPEALVEPCIKVSTSQKGVCPKCGSQWARIIESKNLNKGKIGGKNKKVLENGDRNDGNIRMGDISSTTLGWKATCSCGIEETEPALVLDPFMCSGTVGMVAAKLGRNYVGIEINPDYIENQAKYRLAEGETGIPKQELISGQKALFD